MGNNESVKKTAIETKKFFGGRKAQSEAPGVDADNYVGSVTEKDYLIVKMIAARIRFLDENGIQA